MEIVAVLGHSAEGDAVVNVLAIIQNESQINKFELNLDHLAVERVPDILLGARLFVFPVHVFLG